MKDDNWRLENTWSSDQSQQFSLTGVIQESKVSFTLTETDEKTGKV